MVSFDTFNCNWLWYLFDVLAMLLVMCIITILPGSVPAHHWMLIAGSCLAYLVHSRWWVLFLSYIMNQRLDAIRFVQKEFSLKLLMGYCLDFEEKETLLQSMAGKGNGSTVLVEPTPKCHWICRIGESRSMLVVAPRNFTILRLPWGGKREKRTSGLWWLVRKSMSRDKVLTTKRYNIFHGEQDNIYVHTSRFGEILTNNKMTGWTPKLTQHMMWTPSALRTSLSNHSKQISVPSFSTQISGKQNMSMI